MLELSHEHDGDLLDFYEKVPGTENSQKKVFGQLTT
jgi:hypothetical protein